MQGSTPLEVWSSDSTEITRVSDAHLVANMMVADRTYKVDSGVHHRYNTYICWELNALNGRQVHVRYLPRRTDYIAVSVTSSFDDVFFAHRADLITAEDRNALLAERGHQNRLARQVDANARALKAHRAAVRDDLDDDELRARSYGHLVGKIDDGELAAEGHPTPAAEAEPGSTDDLGW